MMDRALLKGWFPQSRFGGWQCPTCGRGVLTIEPGSFHAKETKGSRNHQNSISYHDPYSISYVFSTLLTCKHCKEFVACSGVGVVEVSQVPDNEGGWEYDYEDIYQARFFQPNLRLFDVPAKCPKTVTVALQDSWRLILASPSGAANHLRIAMEALLTELKVKRFQVVNGTRRFVNLHQRIELLPKRHASVKEMLLAIKWFGNAGSHADGDNPAITMDDVFDGYELMEHVLSEVYAPKSRALLRLAKRVNKAKGPIRNRRGK